MWNTKYKHTDTALSRSLTQPQIQCLHLRTYKTHTQTQTQTHTHTHTHSSRTLPHTKLLHNIETKPDVASYLSVPLKSNIRAEDRREKRLQNRRKWNLVSYHTQPAITNKHTTNKTSTHKHLLKSPPPPAWAYLCSVKSNEADIKGQCGVCVALLGLCDEMSDRSPQEDEWKERRGEKHTGEQLVSIGVLRAALPVRGGFGAQFSIIKKVDINSSHRVCFKQNAEGVK